MHYNAECPGLYYLRLQRDGWRLTERVGSQLNITAVFEKPLKTGWTLRQLSHEECPSRKGKGCYWDEYELRNEANGLWLEYRDWEWADWDRGTLVFVEKGCLYRAPLTPEGPAEPSLLFDFSPMKFEVRKAPY